MSKKLLVGIGGAGAPDGPRRELLGLLGGLRSLGVDTEVVAFADDPLLADLAPVADVRQMAPLPRRSMAGAVEGAIRRISPSLGAKVEIARTRATTRALGRPDCIHLHGLGGMPLLRYVGAIRAPVTVYLHHEDCEIARLGPRDRRDLIARAERFLVEDESLIDGLLAAGIDPDRVESAPDIARLVPAPPASRSDVRRNRAALGLADAGPVVAVPPVAGWTDMPDLTLALAWELERADGPDAPVVLWYGMPVAPDEPWPIAYDIARSDLRRVEVEPRDLPWDDVVDLADVVVLPLGHDGGLPSGFARTAARRATPVLCWEGDPRAGEVAGWGGTVVARSDVRAMADRVRALVTSEAARRQARSTVWRRALTDVERVVPLGLGLP